MYFNNVLLVRIFIRTNYKLLFIAIFTAIVSLIASSKRITKPLYKSTSIVYPANIYDYADENLCEQMYQTLNSTDLKVRILKNFLIDTIFGIKPTEINAEKVNELAKHIKIGLTGMGTIRISVLSYQPESSVAIIDSILKYFNEKVALSHRNIAIDAFNLNELKIRIEKKEIDSIAESSLKNSLIKGYRKESNINLLKSSEYEEINNKINDSILGAHLDILTDLLVKKNFYTGEIEKTTKYFVVVSEALPSNSPFWPNRLLILVIMELSALLLAFSYFAFLEKRKLISEKKINETLSQA